MNDQETLAQKAAKIGDDIAAVWTILQSKGGMIPHHLNTENLQDVISQYDNISMWNAYGLFLYEPNLEYYDFYTTHEVNRMTELPPAPSGSTGWPMTLAEVQASLAENSYVVMAAEGAVTSDLMLNMTLTQSYKSPTLYYRVTLPTDTIGIISWGDGQSTVLSDSGAFTTNHVYTSAGSYTISVTLPQNATFVPGGHTRNTACSIFGPCSTSSSADANKYLAELTNVFFGSKIKFTYQYQNQTYYTTGFGSSRSLSLRSTSDFQRTGITTYPVNSYLANNPNVGLFSGSRITTCLIPEGDYVGDLMFAGNTDLVTCRLPASTTVIPNGLFYHCTSLENCGLDFSTLENIGTGAFADTKCVPDVLDLSSLTELGQAAFRNTTVKKVIFPAREIDSGIYDGLYEYSGHFANCQSLQEVVIPDGPTKIYAGCFYNCQNLTTISLPSTLKEIGTDAFFNARNFDMSIIPNSVETLGGFRSSNITNLVFPTSLKEIGQEAFYNATFPNTSSITIPAGVKITYRSLVPSTQWSGTINIEGVIFNESNSLFEGIGYAVNLVGTPSKVTSGFSRARLQRCYFSAFNNDTSGEKEVIFPRPYNNTGQVESSYDFSEIQTMEAHLGKVTVYGDIYNISGRAFRTWTTGSLPVASKVVGGEFATVFDFSDSTIIPTIDSYAPGTSNAAFYVGSRTVSDRTVSFKPKIIVADNLYNSWIASGNWVNWAQYIVRKSDA